MHNCCCYVWGHDLLIIKLLLMKLHARYMFICILCWFCSKWYKLVLLWLISDGFMFEWGCWWIRYVVVVDLYHGYSILWSCCLNWWSYAKMFMWRTKMNFWNLRLLTEFLMLLDELNLVEFLFSCCDFVSRVVWEKTGFSCENSSVNRFEKWVWCEVLENDFGMVET